MFYDFYDAPFARLLLAGDPAGLRQLLFVDGRHFDGSVPESWIRSGTSLARVTAQLDEYFAGDRREFDLPLAPEGTNFQQRVWRVLSTIPYGHTWSYGQVAAAIGQPTASRAVGAANGRNPISIVVPCHRVIGSSGRLVGFGGGLPSKQWLLTHERSHSAETTPALF